MRYPSTFSGGTGDVLPIATTAVTVYPLWGYFRLHEHQSGSGFAVLMDGHVNYADHNITILDSQNINREETFLWTTVSGGKRRRMRADVWGLDDENREMYKDYDNSP